MNKNSVVQLQQNQPGIEAKMQPQPIYYDENHQGSNKLLNKVALITGADSGIGRAIACLYAQEGCDIIIHYLNEHEDAKETQRIIETLNRRAWLMPANLQDYENCEKIVQEAIEKCGKIDILINNIGEQHPQEEFEDISCEQMLETFRTNFFSYFYMIKACLPHLKQDAVIINTTSVTAYKGSDHLIDYSATKGAIIALTRSLSQNLIKKGIRVNAVAPGPIWTPLIPSTFSEKEVKEFGQQVPMKRPGQPVEVAPTYLFLAANDSSYMTGQVLHPNGGVIVNS